VSRRRYLLPLLLGCLSILGTTGLGRAQPADQVQLQLKWVPQAQFAGYYAARAKGLYAAEKLDVTIRPGGPDIVAEEIVVDGGAQFGIDWLPSLLAARDRGAPLVNIAQLFAYSGMREIALKSSGIKNAADLRGRRVAVWFGGSEFELFATLEKYKIDWNRDMTLVPQAYDMNLLLQKKVAAAAAMTYNEYKQVLDAGVRPEDLVVIDFNREGTAMLEDGIFVREDWIRDARNKAIAARFLRASLKGWELCRDKPSECVGLVLNETKGRGQELQAWMMAEVNKLVWGPPAPRSPVGKMDPEAFKRTAEIAYRFGVIKKTADPAAYTHEIWETAQKKPARAP
jgi:NitT/TauT family transport system substrate-binding protein